jgi:hypothetical protein
MARSGSLDRAGDDRNACSGTTLADRPVPLGRESLEHLPDPPEGPRRSRNMPGPAGGDFRLALT